MEAELSKNLFELADSFRHAKRLTESTVGKMCAADGRFFSRIRDGKTFTVKKYDDLVEWFSANWPDEAEWPAGIERPETKSFHEAAE